jgi:chromosome segregation ATPase
VKPAAWLTAGAVLWLAAGAALGQTGVSGKSLGGEAAQGALLTRDELRACLAEQAVQAERAATLERRRGEIDAQAAAVRQQLADVQAERLAFGRWQHAAQAFRERAQKHGERVALFNQRIKAFQESRPTAAGAERERGEIEAEAEALAKADAQIKAEGAQLDANVAQARSTLTARAQAQADAAAAANAANAQFNADVQAHEAARADWQQRCGSRPYRTADEQAVRAEKR